MQSYRPIKRAPSAGQSHANKPNFRTNISGTTAILTGFLIVPVIGAAGLAIDFARAQSVQTVLQAAADSAAVATIAAGDDTSNAITARAEAIIAKNATKLHGSGIDQMTVTYVNGTATVELESNVATTFSKIMGMDTIPVSVISKAQASGGALEIALVLDNTGSMSGHMDDLKSAANDLVSKVYASAADASSVRFAIVPYAGAVNIGNEASHMAWMDTAGDASWNGDTFEDHWIAFQTGCDYTPTGGGSSPDPGTGSGSDRSEAPATLLNRFAAVIGDILGISSAKAAPANGFVPPGGYARGGYDDCWILNPTTINHFDLFNAIPNESWKGCVEARAEPYDVTDTPPGVDPNTKFVPYFWADEPDNGSPDVFNFYPNDYMGDGTPPAGFEYQGESDRLRNIFKYNGVTIANIDTTAPSTLGPNQACPDPILPLTEDETAVSNTINALSHWEGSGTVSSEGVAWGWRVLSPGVPFDEGAAYGEASKYLVFMTDGKNGPADQVSTKTLTDYTAYGYLKYGRINPNTYETYINHINDRMIEVCTNAKAEGIEIYTITFGDLDSATTALYEQCASMPPYHFTATTVDELQTAFQQIGQKITRPRITQ